MNPGRKLASSSRAAFNGLFGKVLEWISLFRERNLRRGERGPLHLRVHGSFITPRLQVSLSIFAVFLHCECQSLTRTPKQTLRK